MTKKCPKCKKILPLSSFYLRNGKPQCHCKKCSYEYVKAFYKRKPYKRKEYYNKDAYRETVKIRHLRIKTKVINHYGSKCSCCGESNIKFLTLDHTKGDGAQRKRDGEPRSSLNLYYWIIRNSYPKHFTVLCWNCNSGRYFNKGICPHKELL